MRVFRKIWNFITTILVVVVVLLAIALVGVRFFGYTPYTVQSGSMEPTYHVGSLIYVQKIAPEDIAVGTPITFVVNDDLLIATHRVVKVDKYETKTQALVNEAGEPILDEDGNPMTEEVPLDEPSYYFTTKGDANEAEDGSPVYYKNVVGTPKFTLPYLGYLSAWLQTRKGMIAGITGALVLLLLMFVPDIIRALDDEEPKKKKKKKRRKKKKNSGKQHKTNRNEN